MSREVKAPKLKPLVINDPDHAALKWTGEQPMKDQVRAGPKSKPRSTEQPTKDQVRAGPKSKPRSTEQPTKDQVQSEEKSKPRSKRKRRATRQKTFTIRNEEELERVAAKLGLSQTAVINLGLSMVIKKFG